MAQRAHNTLDGHPEVKEELHRFFLYSWELTSHLVEHKTHTLTEQVFRFYTDTFTLIHVLAR